MSKEKYNKEKETNRKCISYQKKILTVLKNDGGFLEYDRGHDKFKYIPEKYKSIKEINND